MTAALPRLRPGERVRIVSPSSPPDRDGVMRGSELLSHWGLIPEIAPHAFDRHGHYLAGRDEDRLADLNDALRDPGVRAIFTTRGGKGAYRIADRIDFDAAARDPKPLVGFSDTTILHLALWHRACAPSVHGPHVEWHGPLGRHAAERLRRVLMESAPIVVRRDSHEITAAVTSAGTVTGTLMGDNLSLIARAVGWTCPSFAGAILLVEDVDKHIGHIDSALTQLLRSGVLDGLRGIAIGQFIRCAEPKPGKWSIVDVLRDRLLPLGVPILGGLPIGHGPDPHTVPLGAAATIDVTAGTLTAQTDVA